MIDWAATRRQVETIVRRVMYRDQEDAVQDVMVAIVRAERKFEARRGSWSAFVHIITKRTCIDILRARAAKPLPMVSMTEDLAVIDDRLEIGDQHAAALAAMSKLSERRRAILQIVYGRRMQMRHAAEQMGMPLGTLKAEVARSLEFLRRVASAA